MKELQAKLLYNDDTNFVSPLTDDFTEILTKTLTILQLKLIYLFIFEAGRFFQVHKKLSELLYITSRNVMG